MVRGKLLCEGLRFSGTEVSVVNTNEIKSEGALNGYDAYVFGSATYHGEMMQGMKNFLFLAEKAGLAGKAGGAFGWSGEAPDRIFDTMKNVYKMDMESSSLRLKSISLGGGIKMAQDYGRELAKKLGL